MTSERVLEGLYAEHSAALMAFCRHLLGSREEAEDVLQQTFVRALRALRDGVEPEHPRAWLFTIARNRALSVLSARREVASDAMEWVLDTDGLAEAVERRSELRALLADIASLPEPQRAALLLAQIEDFPQRRIAEVLGTTENQVKTLVYRARQALMADRAARAVPCGDIRAELAVAHGPALRRAPLRRHLRQCPGCRAFQRGVALQRDALAALLPVGVPAGLLARVLGSSAGGAAIAGGAGGVLVKVAIAVVVGGTAVGGATIGHVNVAPEARAQTAVALQAATPTGAAVPFTPARSVLSATPTPTVAPAAPGTEPSPAPKGSARGVVAPGRSRAEGREATKQRRTKQRRAAFWRAAEQQRAVRQRRAAGRTGARLTPAQRRAARRAATDLTPAQRQAAINTAQRLTPTQRATAINAARDLTPAQRRAAVNAAAELTPAQRRAVVEAAAELTPAQREAAANATPEQRRAAIEAARTPREPPEPAPTATPTPEPTAAATPTIEPAATPEPPSRRERLRRANSGP